MLSQAHRTNIVLNEVIVQEALKLSHLKTKRALIDTALKEYIANHKAKSNLDTFLDDMNGKSPFFDDYDYKAMRVNPHLPDED